VLIQVVGDSGSGKTLVVQRSVRQLTARGLRVAVVKHSHHPPDLRGKDTARAMAAGATAVLFASRPSFVSFHDAPPELIAALPVDVVLIEGYSRRRFGAWRFRIRRPGEARRIVRLILEAAPPHADRPSVIVDGQRRTADPIWRFVLGVMAARNVREIRRPP